MSQITDIVVLILVLGVAGELFRSGKIDEVFKNLQSAIPTTAPAPAPAPAPVPEAAPAPEGGGGEQPAATETAAPASCDCKCMPMDSDPNKFKIETPAKEDCYGHVYPASMAECETALKDVCAKRAGGGSNTPADAGQPVEGGADDKAADSGGGGGGADDKAAEGGDDKKKESNYARTCTDYTPMNWG